MNEHVGKPIDLEKLVATLRFQTGREDSQASSGTGPNMDEALIEHRALIIERFGGNLDLIGNVLKNFGPELEKQFVRLHDQIQRQDASGAAFVLHAIKGSSGTMGANALSRLAGNVEYQLSHEDAKSAVSVLTDPTWFGELGRLLQQSLEQLNADFGQGPRVQISIGRETMEPMQWKESLEEILLLLEAGNLQAIELADALVSKTPSSLRPQFDELVDMVHSLDFSTAVPIGRDLLRSA
jgi:HPt (histidine-containing phosphotransfer) domain-containing protein